MAKTQHSPKRVTLFVGPEKTASTFVQKILELHPDIRLPRGIKETFFFERFFDNGVNWYLGRFDLSDENPHLVEVAPGCFCEEDAIARIKATFPQARIIICAREPVERTISHYNHLRRYGYLNAPFADSLNPDEKPVKASLYQRYCPMWEEAFGADNVKMLDMELLRRDAKAFAQSVFAAADITPIEVPEAVLSARSNESAAPRHFWVARVATSLSNLMKRHGLYKFLDVLRNSPIHALVYGDRKVEHVADVDVMERLEVLLAPERAYLQKHYGITYIKPDSRADA
jgi:hypothetical protein